MENQFITQLIKSNAGTNSRNSLFDFVTKNHELLPYLINFAFDTNQKEHYKGIWIIEMIAEKETPVLFPFLDTICNQSIIITNKSATRGLSRTLLFVSYHLDLNENQEEKIIEKCLDWLISDERVACKAYAIRTLFYYSKKQIWLKEELKTILESDYNKHSSAYKAVAREILKKLQNNIYSN